MAGRLELDDALIRRLSELLRETGLSEIEIGEGDRHVRVVALASAPVAPAEPSRAAMGPSESAAAAAAEAGAGEIEASHPGAVASPMVGTVYLTPEPGAPPFVTKGQHVREGDTMFVIEAMKTMNPVRAPRDGRIARIIAVNAAPVEYGEVLALIE